MHSSSGNSLLSVISPAPDSSSITTALTISSTSTTGSVGVEQDQARARIATRITATGISIQIPEGHKAKQDSERSARSRLRVPVAGVVAHVALMTKNLKILPFLIPFIVISVMDVEIFLRATALTMPDLGTNRRSTTAR